MTELVQFLAEKGFHFTPICDGTFQRFDRTRENSGWFVGRELTFQDQTILVAWIGDWASGERYEFKTTGNFSHEMKSEIDRHLASIAQKEKAARDTLNEEVAVRSEAKWKSFGDRGRSPYLEKKGLPNNLYGCRLYPVPDGVLTVVPARDVSGKLWGLQYIKDDGTKNFASGMRIKGCHHLIGELKPHGKLYVAEGIATAASLVEATGESAVAAFNAGNLESVVEAYSEKYPDLEILVCGDDDRHTRKPDGSAWNPGREYAERACRSGGHRCFFPRFSDPSSRFTDWNDLHASEGIDEVRKQLESGLMVSDGLTPVAWGSTKKGTPVPPSDQQVADALLDHYEGRIVKHEEDLFLYTGTHWKHLQLQETHEILQQIQTLYSGQAGIAKLEAIYKLFLTKVTPAPVDMFVPNSAAANFLNGTLHAIRGSDYKYRLEFRPHHPGDFVTHVVPLKYQPELGEKNAEFELMLGRVFADDPDQESKIRAVRQMYGSCLMPLYPRLFLLHGRAGSGKSSLIIPAQKLVHQDNWASVEPHEFKGFLMETMVGKLVNIVTDIKTTEPIDDSNLKKIEDRVPVRIDRKFQRAVYAPFPAVHIFGANDVPPTLDGGSGAHARRWTFIHVEKYRAEGTNFRKDFANWVFEQGPGGILNFALEGLRDLLDLDGHFTNPESGKAALVEWQLANDPVGLFLRDVEHGEVDDKAKLILGPGAKIPRVTLYDNFRGWSEKNRGRGHILARHKFFDVLRSKGFKEKKVQGVRFFEGIGSNESPTGVDSGAGSPF